MRRKISAILCLDVVDYTQRMSSDAEGTLRILNRILEDIVVPSVTANSGRIFKLLGDGALAAFGSATDAINATSRILRKMQDEDISLRAGVHVGDVLPNGTDLFGEAVNVAARLQAQSLPGNCLISKTAVDVAGTSLSIPLRSERSMRLKGVPNPIEFGVVITDEQNKIPSTKNRDKEERETVPRNSHTLRESKKNAASSFSFWVHTQVWPSS